MEEIKDIFDRTFKRIFSLSNAAILSLINGLFDTCYPPDSRIDYMNRESTDATLKHHFADVFLVVNSEHPYHLEAQVVYDDTIVLRVFEYGFHHAMDSRQDNSFQLDFPEPVVIYLVDSPKIPAENTLHIDFHGQGTFDYKVRSFIYPRHTMEELEQKQLIVLIPFQMLRLRAILYDRNGQIRNPTLDEFQQLKEIVTRDIMDSIKANLAAKNITHVDAAKLVGLANTLYEQILLHYQNRGGEQTMGVMLPGAIELPNEDLILKLERLEKLEEIVPALTDENAALADENNALAEEIANLKTRLAELESKK